MSASHLHESTTNGLEPGCELADRIIEPSAFVADTEAFVDVRLARSKGKASYSFIGPGVSQNDDQVINLMVPHGFNVGAATMPHGAINNPHLHFTAEVFICTAGSYRFDIGEHGEQSVVVEAGTVFSVPTWVFRSFENTGPDKGWLFAVLGGDDTGGIIWAPHILEEAAKTGMHLSKENVLLDANAGDDVSDALKPLEVADLEGQVATYSTSELLGRAVSQDQLQWSERSLLSSVLSGHEAWVAPVLGHGLTQDRSHSSPITNPHGFSLEWLEVAPGSSTGLHRHTNTQATFLVEGDWEIHIDTGVNSSTAQPAVGSIVSIPEGAWRNLTNVGDTPAKAVVVCGSDGPTRLEWSDALRAEALAAGWTVDAAGYLAPAHLIRVTP